MVTQTERERSAGGRELPAPGRWDIDQSHSEFSFVARHMMITKIRGRFREVWGTIDVAETPEQSSVVVVVKAASIDTGDADRDRHLRSPDFLDVERYPDITFHSAAVRPKGDDRWELTGDLTIRDVTRSVTFDVEYCGTAVDPWGHDRAGFLAIGEINREDFDITWNQVLESGGFLVGKGVRIEADVEAVRSTEG